MIQHTYDPHHETWVQRKKQEKQLADLNAQATSALAEQQRQSMLNMSLLGAQQQQQQRAAFNNNMFGMLGGGIATDNPRNVITFAAVTQYRDAPVPHHPSGLKKLLIRVLNAFSEKCSNKEGA